MAKLALETKLTRQYVRLQERIAKLEEQAKNIKEQIAVQFPEGVKTPEGDWIAVGEGVRFNYSASKMQTVIEKLVRDGNSELASLILNQRTESKIQASMRFNKAK